MRGRAASRSLALGRDANALELHAAQHRQPAAGARIPSSVPRLPPDRLACPLFEISQCLCTEACAPHSLVVCATSPVCRCCVSNTHHRYIRGVLQRGITNHLIGYLDKRRRISLVVRRQTETKTSASPLRFVGSLRESAGNLLNLKKKTLCARGSRRLC